MLDNLKLTNAELVLFSEILWDLGANKGSMEARKSTLEKVISLLRADFGSSYIYDSVNNISNDGFSINITPEAVAEHNDYWQFNESITSLLRQKQSASTVEDVMSRKQFEETSFYNDYLKPNNMYDGNNIYFVKGGQDIGDIRVWKEKDKQPFGSREKILLNTLEPYFTEALPAIHEKAILTSREKEIATFIQKGFSDKEVAKLLDISHSTVRTHVKHVFGKLGCSNRTELATMLHHGLVH